MLSKFGTKEYYVIAISKNQDDEHMQFKIKAYLKHNRLDHDEKV